MTCKDLFGDVEAFPSSDDCSSWRESSFFDHSGITTKAESWKGKLKDLKQWGSLGSPLKSKKQLAKHKLKKTLSVYNVELNPGYPPGTSLSVNKL